MLDTLLHEKIAAPLREMIANAYPKLSSAEQDLLRDILGRFDFTERQAQVLADALTKQVAFDPWAHHAEDDEEGAGVCSHCSNPPPPPLLDYLSWRKKLQN